MSEIIVLGSLNMDLVVRAERMPSPGETVRGEGFTTVPGGKGANQAAAAAKLGAEVWMVGRVGADDFGRTMLANLVAQGIETSCVTTDPGAPSGVALITLDAEGENTIVVAPGANNCVTMGDVRDAAHLLEGAGFLVMQLEIPLDVVRGAISIAHDRGVPVVLNAAPAARVDSGFLRDVDYLVVNMLEAQLLAGESVIDLPSAARAARTLHRMGPPVVVVTMGAQGAYLFNEQQSLHLPAHRVEVVDTTAAGDAFVGGFVVALQRGYPLAEAVRYGTCAGTCATMRLGAQTSLPSPAQVQALYEAGCAY